MNSITQNSKNTKRYLPHDWHIYTLKIHIKEEKICLIYIVIYVNFIWFKKH